MLGYDVLPGLSPDAVFTCGMIMRGNVLKAGFYRSELPERQELLSGALREMLKVVERPRERGGVIVALADLQVGEIGNRLVAPSGLLITRDSASEMLERLSEVAGGLPETETRRTQVASSCAIEGFEPDFEVPEETRESRSPAASPGSLASAAGLYRDFLRGVVERMEEANASHAIVLHKGSLMTFLHEFAHYLQQTGALYGSRDSAENEAEARNWSHTVFFVMSPYEYRKGLQKRNFYHAQIVPLPPIGLGERFVSFDRAVSRWREFFLRDFAPRLYPELRARDVELAELSVLARGMGESFSERVAEIERAISSDEGVPELEDVLEDFVLEL